MVLLFCLAEGAVIALSSWQFNPPDTPVPGTGGLPQAALIYGGNEEVGWRGTMQPLLERAVPFPGAAVVTAWSGRCGISPVVCGGGLPADYPLRMVCVLAVLQSFWYGALFSQDPLGLWLQPGPWPDQYLALSVCHPGQRPFGGGVPAVAGGLLVLWYRTPWEAALGGGERGKGRGECREKGLPFPAPYGTIS